MQTDANKQVVIYVNSGVAEIAEIPDGVSVHILDFDVTNNDPNLCACDFSPHEHNEY